MLQGHSALPANHTHTQSQDAPRPQELSHIQRAMLLILASAVRYEKPAVVNYVPIGSLVGSQVQSATTISVVTTLKIPQHPRIGYSVSVVGQAGFTAG